MKDVNLVIIKGKLVHRFFTPKNFCIATIFDGANNFVKVFICNENDLRLIQGYNINDYIEIEGNIQSTIRENKNKTTTIFCDRIVDAPYQRMGYKNSFVIRGTVKRIKVINNTCWHIFVATYVNDRYSIIPAVIYYPDVRAYPQEPGEKICLMGCVQTTKKTSVNGQTVYYQNYVVK